MIKISEPYFKSSLLKEIKNVIKSGWISQGPVVSKFEMNFSQKFNLSNCLAVNSCTSGLELIGKTLDLKKDDEVIIPSFTWISSANFIENLKAKPIFVDIDINTFNLDVNSIKKKLTRKTKAVVGVHLFGHAFDFHELQKVIDNKKVFIIEDAACALGTKYKNKFVGNLGYASSFSFHPRKSITTGEGGIISTTNKMLSKKINSLRNHGSLISEETRNNKKKNTFVHPDFILPGHNYRMTDIQGILGLHQMQFVDQILEKRKKIAHHYIENLKNIDWIVLPDVKEYTDHSWQSFVIRINKKLMKLKASKIMKILENKGIATRFGTHAIHTLSYYKNKYNLKQKDYPNSYSAMDESISLPIHYKLTKSQLNYIVAELNKI